MSKALVDTIEFRAPFLNWIETTEHVFLISFISW